MSLLNYYEETCVKLTETRISDGEGGETTTTTESEPFKAYITLDNSIKTVIAKQNKQNDTYTVITSKDIVLAPYEIIKRRSDGLTLRVIATYTQTPASSTLDLRKVSAERWELN